MKAVFFSMRTFEKDGGGSIRMYGVLNALAEKGHEVIFISNAKNLDRFHPNIRHIHINWTFSEKDKRIFQGLLGTLPIFLFRVKYAKFINHLAKILRSHELSHRNIVFFEYLDNSIGYLLKRLNLIKSYVNDIHGIATIEFKYELENSSGWKAKTISRLKYNISRNLDYHVFKNALGVILASNSMHRYFKEQYNFMDEKQVFILPYVVSAESLNIKVNPQLKESLIDKFNIKPNEFVFFFAGGFKQTSGVEDLINAFKHVNDTYNNVRLLILGRGDLALKRYKKLTNQLNLEEKVQFIDSVPYYELRTYQDLSDVIVCPDRQNPYSELIVHLKYFDALASGKLVINGGFESVTEINNNECLSLNFKPSDEKDLLRVMKRCIDENVSLKEKYQNNQKILAERLTYHHLIDAITAIP